MVSAGREPADVREVEVLGNKKAGTGLCGLPYGCVGPSGHSFQVQVIHVMAERRQGRQERFRQVLVQLNPHAGTGVPRVGRSSSAEAAAKAITARTAGSVKVGKSA